MTHKQGRLANVIGWLPTMTPQNDSEGETHRDQESRSSGKDRPGTDTLGNSLRRVEGGG